MTNRNIDWEEVFEYAGFENFVPMAILWDRFTETFRKRTQGRLGPDNEDRANGYREMRQILSALRGMGLCHIPDPSGYYTELAREILCETPEEDMYSVLSHLCMVYGESVAYEVLLEEFGVIPPELECVED